MMGSSSSPRPARSNNARRSHHACDQCRKSKRACDAPQLAQPTNTSSTSLLLLNQNLHAPAPKVSPCSYCAKTKKECTMNWAWSQLQIATALEAASRGEFRLDGPVPTKRQRFSPTEDQQPEEHMQQANKSQSDSDIVGSGSEKAIEPSIPPHFFDQSVSGAVTAAPQKLPGSLPGSLHGSLHGSLPDEYPFDISHLTADAHHIAVHDAAFHVPSIESLDPSAACLSGSLPPGLCCSSEEVSSHHTQPVPDLSIGVYPSIWHDDPSDFSQRSAISSTTSDASGRQRSSKRRRMVQSWAQEPASSLSPFSIDQSMMARSSNGFISANLLQIYHDVLEHNLSCWLTELTCPYKDARGSAQRSDGGSEWGPLWSNRIYRRTLKLDQVAQSTKLIQLTRSEDQAANRALNLAIMAFATQWAQGSRRQRERYSSPTDAVENPLAESFDELAEEFDRNLQRHFWDQAQRALQDVADVESYKAVCAELVFGLAQKPWSQDDARSTAPEAGRTDRTGNEFEQESLMSEISRTISKDGPPIYLERAARKMHALKFRFDNATKGPAKGRRSKGGVDAFQVMGDEDRGTVGLLYWLAVMFDTVSSSMNERPVVVTDQDCQHDSVQQQELDTGRWKIDLFIQDKLETPCRVVHWPCTYEAAAEAVTKSGPVKVLLYRHVSYLQNGLRRGQHGQPVEDIIRSTTSLYRYWNMTHGAFFRELVQNFDYVPGRIRSWFVCISAHWHLAALMLADLIETVDEEDLGVSANTQRRLATKMVARIRETSVRELSDLARVSTPADAEAGFMAEPQLPEFHHAVYEGTILTEPWTIILIRAFSRAAVLLLGDADDCRQYGLSTHRRSDDSPRDMMHQAEDCIRALFFLGKKSDMARRVADVLSGALAKLRPSQASVCVGLGESEGYNL